MRFNGSDYRKAFPKEKPKEKIETAVESFTPTQDEIDGKDGDSDADGDGDISSNDTEQ